MLKQSRLLSNAFYDRSIILLNNYHNYSSKLLGTQNDWNKNKLKLVAFQIEIAENLGQLISKIAIIEFWYDNIVCDPPDFLEILRIIQVSF